MEQLEKPVIGTLLLLENMMNPGEWAKHNSYDAKLADAPY